VKSADTLPIVLESGKEKACGRREAEQKHANLREQRHQDSSHKHCGRCYVEHARQNPSLKQKDHPGHDAEQG